MTNIETPEGWEPVGHRFVRAYGHKLAVMAYDPSDGTWLPWIHESVNSVYQGRWKPLPEAVAWANAQLGVPKPVEVVEIECEDGALFHSSDRKRFALMHGSPNGRWYVSGVGIAAGFCDHDEALIAARAYVRGDA